MGLSTGFSRRLCVAVCMVCVRVCVCLRETLLNNRSHTDCIYAGWPCGERGRLVTGGHRFDASGHPSGFSVSPDERY